MTKEPVVCQACSDFLEKASNFMINSLNVEQKIKNYYESSEAKEQIDLFNVLEFAFPKIEMDNGQNEDEPIEGEDTNFTPTDLLQMDEQQGEEKTPTDTKPAIKSRP